MRYPRVIFSAYRLESIWGRGIVERTEVGAMIISKPTEDAIEELCAFVKEMRSRERKPEQNRGRKPIALPTKMILEGMLAREGGRVSNVAKKLGVHRDTIKKRLKCV